MKKWVIGKAEEKAVENIMECGCSKLCAQVLSSRGVKNAQQAMDLVGECTLQDPFVLAGMQKAVETIENAVDEGRLICIYGDYDCDGIMATAMLYTYLECMGAQVMTYIPERHEGYGMSIESVNSLADMGVELIITVDNGISAIAEAEEIARLGVELVVTDHHQPGDELPNAAAVVNPHRFDCPSEFKKLCGAGVVLKLIAALEGGDYDTAFEQFGDLAAVATIADIVDICSENRYIVQNGLRLLENTENLGLSALLDACSLSGKELDSNSVAFMLTPKINAAGRFASPKIALDLMLCDDEEQAIELAQTLIGYNNSRRLSENEIMADIDRQIAENPEIVSRRLILLNGEGWHCGVIGIICARMVERYSKPCFIISTENGVGRGSARSFEGFSVFKSLEYCADLLDNYGGHLGAGGFTVKTENIDAFFDRLLEFADNNAVSPLIASTKADKLLRKEDFSVENVMGLEILAPYGTSNPEPVFLISGAKVNAVTAIGGGKHCRLSLFYDGITIQALLFRVSSESFKARIGEKIDALVTLDINEWNGRVDVSIKVKDYRVCGINQQKYFEAKQAYDDYICKKALPRSYYRRMLPTREELTESYKQLYAAKGDIDTAFARLSAYLPEFNFCRFRIALDVFKEKNLIDFDVALNKCTVLPATKKVDIFSCAILADINAKAQ